MEDGREMGTYHHSHLSLLISDGPGGPEQESIEPVSFGEREQLIDLLIDCLRKQRRD
jgi:hypothetical protein